MGSITYGVRDVGGLGVFGHGYISFNFGDGSHEFHGGPSEGGGLVGDMGPEDFFAAIFEYRALVTRVYDPTAALYGGRTVYAATLADVSDKFARRQFEHFEDTFSDRSFRNLPYEVGVIDPSNSNLFYAHAVTRAAVEVVRVGFAIEHFNLNGGGLLMPGLNLDRAISLLSPQDRSLAEMIVGDNQRRLDFQNAYESYAAAHGDPAGWRAGDWRNVGIAAQVGASFDEDGGWAFDSVADWIDAMDAQLNGYVDEEEGDLASEKPILLDLDDDGVEVNIAGSVFFDFDDDGYEERTAWAASDDAFLVIDLAANGSPGGDGRIDQAKELAFPAWLPADQRAGVSDLDALARVFDSNRDGVFDNRNARWGEIRVWRDKNQNGVVDPGEMWAPVGQGPFRMERRMEVATTCASDTGETPAIPRRGLSSRRGRRRAVRAAAAGALLTLGAACAPPPIKASYPGDSDKLVMELIGNCTGSSVSERFGLPCEPDRIRHEAPQHCTTVGDGFACQASRSSRTKGYSPQTGEPIEMRSFVHTEILFAPSGARCDLGATALMDGDRVGHWLATIRHRRADGSKARSQIVSDETLDLTSDIESAVGRWLFKEVKGLS